MDALLELRDVSKVYGGGMFGRTSTIALETMSLTIFDGKPTVTVVAGESGSGKTTLANLLLGIVEPTTGRIMYRGKDLTEMSAAERMIFRRDVQVIFQDPFESYNPFHKVDRVLRAPIRKFRRARTEDDAKKLISGALEMVGLRPEDTLGRFPHELSGGQRQRIMMARALVLQPRIIIADEPVSMVDASLRATILESLLRLNRELGISLIYITHDLTTAYQVGDSAIILYQGIVAESGSVDLVIKNPKHPYTQQLVDSIPLADPDLRWGRNTAATATDEDTGIVHTGCKFVRRCPHAMAECSERRPPIYRTEARHGVACFLYRESPALASAELERLLKDASHPGLANIESPMMDVNR